MLTLACLAVTALGVALLALCHKGPLADWSLNTTTHPSLLVNLTGGLIAVLAPAAMILGGLYAAFLSLFPA